MQLRNIINRRNIGKSVDVTSHVNEVEDFLVLVITCHLTAAALQFFNMSTTSDSPHSNGFPTDVAGMPLHKRKKLLFDRLERLIDEYVVSSAFKPHAKHPQLSEVEVSRNPHFTRIQMEHSYLSTQQCKHRYLPPTVTTLAPCPRVSHAVRTAAPDGVFNYASAVLNDGLLLLEFKDAIREGDGVRILRCWKALMVYFHYSKHTNYQQEAFYTLALTSAAASPRVASQLTWSRVVNARGGRGRNIPVDLRMEHLNRAVKDYIGNLGANVTESTILQCGKSLNGILATCQCFDNENGIRPQSVAHTQSCNKSDKDKILKQLAESSVFQYVPGRKHHNFQTIQPSVVSSVDKKKLVDWIQCQKKDFLATITLAKVYGHKM